MFRFPPRRRGRSHSGGRCHQDQPSGGTCPAEKHSQIHLKQYTTRQTSPNQQDPQTSHRVLPCVIGQLLLTITNVCDLYKWFKLSEVGGFDNKFLTCDELSSSTPCEEVERVSSDCPRDPALCRPFSNLPRPLPRGGEESESLATPLCSSEKRKQSLGHMAFCLF